MSAKHLPTKASRTKVGQYASVGIPHEEIARVIGIDAKTLRKHYRDELDIAATKANAVIGGALFKKAKEGDTTAMIWWTKARMGWRGEDAKARDGDPVDEIANALAKIAERVPG